MKKLRLKVPATSANLGPGFDTLGLALSLYNTIEIEESITEKIIFINKNENDYLNNPKNNNFMIIMKKELLQLNPTDKRKFKVTFNNSIPLARGLGSSSSIIVAAVMAAYILSNTKTSKKNILNKSLLYEKHPDNITPALYGGFTISVINNNKIIFQKKELSKTNLKAIVVIPNKKMNTNNNRNILPKTIKQQTAIFNISRSSLLTCAFFTEDWRLLKEASKDKMHQTIRLNNYPILFDVRKTALKNKALMSTLSGSGSTILNLVEKKNIVPLKLKLKELYPEFQIIELDIDNVGLTWKWINE